jgi:translocation and assembly module TamB
MSGNPPKRRGGRPFWKKLAVLAFGLIAGFAVALPWILATGPVRRFLLARANAALAPGGLRFDSLELSWFKPATLTNLALIDPKGHPVVQASHATWDRTLAQILFDRPRYGTLRLLAARLDIHRGADGSLDLYEAIRAAIRPDPTVDLKIVVEGGTLRLHAPELGKPIEAARADISLHIAAAPNPLTFSVELIEGPGAVVDPLGSGTLMVRGELDRWHVHPGEPADLHVSATGRGWPVDLVSDAQIARARFDGQAKVDRKVGRLATSGDATLRDLELAGPRLSGDFPHLDRLAAVWDVAREPEGWNARRLDVDASLFHVSASGPLPPRVGRSTDARGKLDLAQLARQFPRTLRLRPDVTVERGLAEFDLHAHSRPDDPSPWKFEARVADLVTRVGDTAVRQREPATLTLLIARGADGLAVDEFTVKSPILNASGRGTLSKGVKVDGKLDLAVLQEQLADVADLGTVRLAGRGNLSGTFRMAEDHAYLAKVDLGIVGFQAGTAPRDLTLHAEIEGAAGADGFPRGYDIASIQLESAGLTSRFDAEPDQGATHVEAYLTGDAPALGEGARFNAQFQGALHDDASLDVDDMQLSLQARDAPPLIISARGRADLNRGDFELLPPSARSPSPVTLGAEGIRGWSIGRANWRAEATLTGDLDLVDKQLAASAGRKPGGLAGRGDARLSALSGEDGVDFTGGLEIRDASWPIGESRHTEPAIKATIDAHLTPATRRLDLAELTLAGGPVTVEASGQILDLLDRRVVDIKGKLQPDWARLRAMLGDLDPAAKLSGHPRAFRVRGPLGGSADLDEWLAGIDAELGVELTELDLLGLAVGPAPIILRARNGRLDFDPIETTLNGGRLRVEAELDLSRETGPALRLTPGSFIEGARINDQASRRVLAFVAPVLQDATQVRGAFDVAIREARIPLTAAAGKPSLEGSVLFEDVEFGPGPLAEQLLGLVGRDLAPTLRLDQPISLTIADGRVNQHGLAIPLGTLSRIEIDGWVAFDRTMSLTASLPITGALLAGSPLLADLVGGTRLTIPIGGTLDAPRLDRDALATNLKDLGKTLIRRGTTQGAADLLFRLFQRRTATAPAPPTPGGELGQIQPPLPDPAPPTPRQIRQKMRQERRAGLRGFQPEPR